jgi:hypothetical protein
MEYDLDYCKIDSCRKTSNIGKHAPGVYVCPWCDTDIMDDMMPGCKGFGMMEQYVVIVFECPICHETMNYHAGRSEYTMYMNSRERLGLP